MFAGVKTHNAISESDVLLIGGLKRTQQILVLLSIVNIVHMGTTLHSPLKRLEEVYTYTIVHNLITCVCIYVFKRN